VDDRIADASLERRGKSITTFVVYDAWSALEGLEEGQVLELVTDASEPFESDIASWCEAVGHRLLSAEPEADRFRFLIEKGEASKGERSLAMVVSDAGLLELFSATCCKA
jgi:TusA-related sulfurtransferase